MITVQMLSRQRKALFIFYLLLSAEAHRVSDEIETASGEDQVLTQNSTVSRSRSESSSSVRGELDSKPFPLLVAASIPLPVWVNVGTKLELWVLRRAFAHPGLLAQALSIPGLGPMAAGIAKALPAVGGIGARTSLQLSKWLLTNRRLTSWLLRSPLGRLGSGILYKLVPMHGGGLARRAATFVLGKRFAGGLLGRGVQMASRAGAISKIVGSTATQAAAKGGTRFALVSLLPKILPILNIASLALTAWQVWGLIQSIRAIQHAKIAADAAALAAKSHESGVPVSTIVGVGAGIGMIALASIMLARSGIFQKWNENEDLTHSFCPNSNWTIDESMSRCTGLQGEELDVYCDENDDDCHRSACQQLCCSKASCNFFKFSSSVPGFCFLNDLNDGSKVDCSQSSLGFQVDQQKWHGGMLQAGQRNCGGDMWACSSSGECVTSCADCEGFSLAWRENHGGVCRRAPHEAICDDGLWSATYTDPQGQEQNLSSVECAGTVLETVTIDAKTCTTGHAVCRERCCLDPDCVLYQMDSSLTEHTTLEAGDEVICRLGKVDRASNPMFQCKTQGMGLAGAFLNQRGCPEGSYACPSSGECVDTCADKCDASIDNAVARRCDPNPIVTQQEQSPVAIEFELCRGYCRKLLPGERGTKDDRWASTKCKWEKCQQCPECADLDLSATSLLEDSDSHEYMLAAQPDPYFLTSLSPVDLDCLEKTHLAEIPMILDQNKANIITPGTEPSACELLQSSCGCKSNAKAEEDCSCIAEGQCTADATSNTCKCRYKKASERQPRCDDWFEHKQHLLPIVEARGMVLLTGDGCSCSSDVCSFEMLSKLPPLRISQDDTAIINFDGGEMEPKEEQFDEIMKSDSPILTALNLGF